MLVFIILVVVVLIFMVLLFSLRKNSVDDFIKQSFERTDEKGGFLISMFANTDAQKILDKKKIEYADFDQCASINRKTCAAFSLFRRDIWCCPFITPGIKMNIGIILKTETFWPLLTGAFVIDANTNNRVACSNENGSDIDIDYGCIFDAFGRKMTIKSSDSGVGPSKCDPSDEQCRYLNSGGGLNIFDRISSGQPCKCATATGNNVSLSTCDTCKKVYLCSNNIPNPSRPNPYYNDENTITAYLGPKSALWTKLFTTDNFDTGYTSANQCKFKRENLQGWKDALYSYYTLLLAKNPPFNPTAPNYFENELNAYIYPDKTSQIYKDQEKIFMNSIAGFFYIGNTCEQQLVGGSSNPEADCNTATGLGTAERRMDEQKEMDTARKNSIELAKIVSDFTGDKVAVYKAILDSNNFPNKKSINDAMNGRVNFDDMFTLQGIY